jgi:hypothetical protein
MGEGKKGGKGGNGDGYIVPLLVRETTSPTGGAEAT